MSTQLVGPGKDVDRDRYGRPMIQVPNGTAHIPYTRTTTFVDALSDKEGLMKWKQRMTAIGLAARKDLLLKVSTTNPEDKAALTRVCEEAAEQAGSLTAATIGTELHALTERLDRGDTPGPIPDPWTDDIAAYQAATSHLEVVDIESFGVNDEYKVAGTADRIYRIGNRHYIGDIKTGDITYGIGKIAMQLAMYAHMVNYDPRTGMRTHRPHLDLERALIIHLPAGKGECTPVWVDIKAGWEGVALAAKVREWRRRRTFTTPYTPSTVEAIDAGLAEEASAALEAAILTTTTRAELEALYLAHRATWTNAHTALASTHTTTLAQTA